MSVVTFSRKPFTFFVSRSFRLIFSYHTTNPMPKTSLIEALPDIVRKGKKEAEQIMQQIADGRRLKLQTNEIVIPSKDTNYQTLFENFKKEYDEKARQNRLIYGDNLLTMAALIAGDEANGVPSLR